MSAWVDPDDAPELTEQHFERAAWYDGERLIRRPGTVGTCDRFTDPKGQLWKLTRKGWRNFTKSLARKRS